ncbi:non-ribosomal peptide synthetase [Streptomyces caniscabiei]|uniref:Amino acid adenylation domain-containing protein n=1 Tax=Streptomyces caniscabiei TaxID=2746961 RepID=A0A927L4G8_9ACTN|nr:non-ribosomal peptide synthetase [Streptomyces caniscabiei]MBD9725896.1 amino acid adenylation domain-containing protein [Streptomyces caniscabiei]MDX3507614.1 non-ribosomal peptide synthetase [Streptomyces caniscabiei]MDX3717576.1 non-ribosomal peptide synthetase [Streptomyces caniscabiei]WEO25328.1 non-ribosomal peptide synthetase [Streptomyces caniscabiei]
MADEAAGIPVSAGQERVWLAGQAVPGSPVFNVPNIVLVRARDAEVIRRALERVVERHDALRTSIREADGKLWQVVHPTVRVDVPEHDVRGEPDPEAAARDLVTGLVADLLATDAAPLWRSAAIRVGDEDWWVAFVVHRIVFDAESATVFRRELRALCAVSGPELASPDRSYAEFSAGRRDQDSAEQVAYWRETLEGLPVVHSLPTDRPRPAQLTYDAGEVRFEVPRGVSAGVAELARRHAATSSTVLLAAYATLIARLSGDREVVVGLTVPGRVRQSAPAVIGMADNQVVVRLEVSGDLSFAELVARVAGRVADALRHADVPFQTVVESVAPMRIPSVQPLHQIGFDHHADSELTEVPCRGTTHDLAIELTDGEGRLCYRTDLFDHATAEAVAARYLRVLQAGLNAPDSCTDDLELLDDAERARLFAAPPTTAPDTTVLGLFEEQAARTPDAVAVISGDRRLSYRELEVAATRVAARLRAAGAPAVVGVSAEPCIELLPALLGAWKAGSAWVPVDPGHPVDRVAYLLRDAGAPLVLARSAGTFPVEVLPVGDELGADTPGDPVPGPPGQVAYVLYTSGSTGRPKGVVVEHGSLAAYLTWAAGAYPGLAGQSLVHSTLCFDLTMTGLFGPLVVGGSVHLAPLTCNVSERPTFLKVTPSHLPLLEAIGDVASPTQDLVVGGEALPADALAHWRARNPQARVTNEYGPTEVTVGCVALTVEPGAEPPVDASGGVVIGRPIPGHAAYVLNPAGRPVPDGAPGILHVAGPQVSRGYLGRDSEAYASNPFHPGHRMYATGDLVRRRADGLLEYLGRNDQQIKLRGFRIEPSEIETLLRRQPGVEQAAVAVRGEQLVAYVVGPGHPDPEALARELPDYMVPRILVKLDALPLTTNGKLDSAALPTPEIKAEPDYIAPRTDVELLVAELFADLLGVERIGVEDDFFALGGNSLTAIRTIARIRSQLDVDIPVGGMFKFTTVAALAAEIERLIMAELDALSDEDAVQLLQQGVA